LFFYWILAVLVITTPTLVLIADFQDKLRKSAAEYQTVLDFPAARDYGGGCGNVWNSSRRTKLQSDYHH